ncbi:RRM domain-containing protein [Trichonephila inaurata madagascariensis]|uniref:RRM domain-containing protein n=1 Tax=Trichonephila inaurata madagascariensis TaxID=2747483 RepID=A0A8X6IWA8_9ARAC|nr:RRM domain-containing protein [Trichonephila inaurata madagascariensis]
MQRYNDISECIQMCDRILRTNTYPRKSLIPSDVQEKFMSNASFLKNINTFYPSRTIVVQNFLPEAEAHVQSFVAMFGVVEICELIKEDAPSCLAVVQYKLKRSAADALLAMPYCQVRGSNLIVNLLWNGPYENIGTFTQSVRKSFKECAEKRVVCIGHLPRTITEDIIRRKCEKYGKVENVQVQPQDQGAFAYVVFQSAFSAAIANYCLRNSSSSNAALMLGYSENGSPVLLGPVRVRPLDQYTVPLTAFDVRCICTRFLDYSRMKGLFVNLQRKLPSHHFFRPGAPDYCIRLPTFQAKGVSLFVEILLFEGNYLKNADDITEMAYQICNHKYLFRFSVDFGFNKPIMSYDDNIPRPNQHYLRWNSFFILDLQICLPWGISEPRLEPRIQSMNHIYSDIDQRAFEEDGSGSSWFGVALRYSTCNLAPSGDENQYWKKIKFIMGENLPLVRLVGSYEDINTYQLPIHVFSESHLNIKKN